MKEKEFVGWVKVKDVEHNGNSWQYTQISFQLKDLDRMKEFMNEKGYVNLKLNRSQKGSEYLEIDTYVPKVESNPMDYVKPNAAPTAPTMPPVMPTATNTGSYSDENEDEVPF